MEKKTRKLSLVQKEILFGVILGDAHLETQDNRITYRVKFQQSLKHSPYIDHLYEIFKDYVVTPPEHCIITDKDGNASTTVTFVTVSSSMFTFFGKQFYKNNKKVVPKLIHRWLTPRALAYWYMLEEIG